ncbi:hypothetical protein [Actinoplanes sp. GCM10030250]|uniref:hypothetical protein n=1 Tax=Actinoplanes sp. GCM10030250 TaxID=3273376 RepID=UPI003612F3F4
MVTATWAMSLELADALHPKGLASLTLQLASQLDPHGVPESLFLSNTVRRYLR